MERLDSVSMTNDRDKPIFLYEVVIPSPPLGTSLSVPYRRSRFCLRVSFSQMSRVMRQIHSLGGKIVSIQTLTPIPNQCDQDFNLVKQMPWWVEISTAKPSCLYYFGPFDTVEEAEFHKPGYVEDLENEGADGVVVIIKQCQPLILTQEF